MGFCSRPDVGEGRIPRLEQEREAAVQASRPERWASSRGLRRIFSTGHVVAILLY